jgi:hypothetical protein
MKTQILDLHLKIPNFVAQNYINRREIYSKFTEKANVNLSSILRIIQQVYNMFTAINWGNSSIISFTLIKI